MLRRYLVSDPTLPLKSIFCSLDFGIIKEDCMYWLRSLFTLCASFICLSLSDDANKIKTLNIERAQQFQLPLKIWAQYTRWFRRNSLLKARNFTENVWLVNFFATQLKIAQIPQLNQLFQFLRLFHSFDSLVWVESYANEEKCKQWRQKRFAYWLRSLLSMQKFGLLCLQRLDMIQAEPAFLLLLQEDKRSLC